MEYQQLRWKINEWLFFSVTFCLLLLFPLINGYPFFHFDSFGYAGGDCAAALRSPVLCCTTMPVVKFFGLWGYVVVQSAVTSFSLVVLSNVVTKLNDRYAYFMAVVLSGLGLFSGWLMADVWALIGLISVFSISVGYGYIMMGAILAFSYSVHHGNFLVLTATAVLFLPFARHRKKYSFVILVSLTCGLLLVGVANMAVGKKFKLSPTMGGFGGLAARILHDMPEVIDEMCSQDPEFKFCFLREDIYDCSKLGFCSELSWGGREKLGLNWKEYNDLGRQVVTYSMSRFWKEHLYHLVRNTYKLFAKYNLSNGFGNVPTGSWAMREIERRFPEDFKVFKEAYQTSGRLKQLLDSLEPMLSWLYVVAIIVCLVYCGFSWKDHQDNMVFQLSAFALIAVLVNAAIMSGLRGPFGRFHTRIGFILIYPALLIVTRYASQLKSHIGLYLHRQES